MLNGNLIDSVLLMQRRKLNFERLVRCRNVCHKTLIFEKKAEAEKVIRFFC